MNSSRFAHFQKWLCNYFGLDSIILNALTGDAGFRQYYRFTIEQQSYIAVDAIPDKSNNLAFIEIQAVLQEQNIQVPQVISYDLQQGFLCISDFGDELFSDFLTLDNMENSYQQAIDLLPAIATAPQPKNYNLPIYNAAFVNLECRIFKEWLLDVHLNIHINDQEVIKLDQCFEFLIHNAIEQPQVVMHRDYHSRNLMMINSELNEVKIGVIDFQDAVIGPITYDVVSLLRDCYVKWPSEKVDDLFTYFCDAIDIKNNYPEIPFKQWQRWFDLMGLQRHIKASGIFARLYHRDNKVGYLKDIPLTLSYIIDIAGKYEELNFLHDLVLNKVLPLIKKENT